MCRTALAAGLALGLFAVGLVRPLRAEDLPASPAPPTIDALLQSPDLDPRLRLELEVFQLITQSRAEAGLPPLQLDSRLIAAAREHSTDMARGGFCRHGGSDGSSSHGRIARHGYPHNNWVGENIICARRTAAAAMKWWLGSGPHRRNILHRHYTHIGIGVDPNGTYGPDWTLTFAAGAADTVSPDYLAPPNG
jgi:uncharacterized protein YkwD